ncbi:hypothetical protein [Edaphobacter aggregans]|uniref:hypothetical protein n=1 Tax=Edaphobacter aggregans TaxID=570835 RepID=UPI00054F12EB|nr:hypothetical protein [Edaphobacter aggregans]
MPTNDHDLNPHAKHDPHAHTPDAPGYETTDVNINGIVVFLSGLVGFLLIFFVFCWVMGKAINGAYAKMDGPADKWHQEEKGGTNLTNLTSNPEFQQRKLQQLTEAFPEPRVDLDDGNQQIADIHAREDLLLEHYSSIPGGSNIRIPIGRAMELIAQRGLPVHSAPAGEVKMAGDVEPQIQTPLTNGFARTSYEQSVIEAREQKMNFGRAEAAAHAELTPAK